MLPRPSTRKEVDECVGQEDHREATRKSGAGERLRAGGKRDEPHKPT